MRAPGFFFRPDKPVSLRLQDTLADDSLLAKSVPQPEDWLRAWRAARTPQSWQAAAQNNVTEHYIRQTRERSVQARPIQQMARIMREVIRARKRDVLRSATSISLGFDDRAGYKLIVFRCDTMLDAPTAEWEPSAPSGSQVAPTASWEPSAVPSAVAYGSLPLDNKNVPACLGIIGCVQTLRGSTLEDFADDYAQRAAREVTGTIARFCTPLDGALDEGLYQHILRSIRQITGDGALQKVAQCLAAGPMPNVRLLTRDPAHMIRLACQDPLVRTGRFEEQNQRLFTGQKALLKSIQFSDGLQARLEECQRVVLRHRGEQGGGVTHIMRHFRFAPHRFESSAGPRRRYVCCLHAIALLLADMAGDQRRQKEERERAEHALDAMTPQDIFEAGVSSDFTSECQRFPILRPPNCISTGRLYFPMLQIFRPPDCIFRGSTCKCLSLMARPMLPPRG